MIALVLVKSLATEYLYDCASYPKIYIDVLEVSAWFVCFRVYAVIVEFAAFNQNLLYVWHFIPCLGLVCSIQKVRVVGIALKYA